MVGCPACNHNFKHFFCTLTCSPDQSTFTNVTAVQKAPDNNRTAVEEVDVFVSDLYGERFFNSCKVRRLPVQHLRGAIVVPVDDGDAA